VPKLSSKTALIVRNLSSWRGDRLLFQHVSFQLSPGEILGLEGCNGSGKSSLLAILAGLLPSSSGCITFYDPLQKDEHHPHPQDICWLGTRTPFYPQLSLWHNLQFWAMLNDFPEKYLKNLFEQFELLPYKDLAIQVLSRGQLQRAHLMRLCLNRARLWLLDEPLTGLDETGRALTTTMIRSFQQQGGLIIIAPSQPEWVTQTLNIENFHPTKNQYFHPTNNQYECT
jgi:heme exporter protein A